MRNVHWVRLFKLCLAMIVMVGSAGVSGAAARQTPDPVWTELGAGFDSQNSQAASGLVDGDTYVLPSSGAEVVVGAGVSADDPSDSDVADQVIVTAPDGIGAVAVVNSFGRPAQTMDAYVGGFAESMDGIAEVDRQDDRHLATGIYRVESGSQTNYLVISVDAATLPGNHIVQVVVAGADVLDDQVVLLRANVTIDGVPMFSDLDEAEVVEIVLQDEASH